MKMNSCKLKQNSFVGKKKREKLIAFGLTLQN